MTRLFTTIQVSLPQFTLYNFHLQLYPFSSHPCGSLLLRQRGDQLGAWTYNYLRFSNSLFIIVARIGHIVGLWSFKCTGWGYNSDADARQRCATGEKEEGKRREALRLSCVLTFLHSYVMHKNLHVGYKAVFLDHSLFWYHQNPQTFWTPTSHLSDHLCLY